MSEMIKSHFKTLKNHAKPTGDLQCPPNVKWIQREIETRMFVATGDDDEQEEEVVDLASGSIEEEEDTEEVITATPAKVLEPDQ